MDPVNEIYFSFPDSYEKFISVAPNLGNDDEDMIIEENDDNWEECFAMLENNDFVIMEIGVFEDQPVSFTTVDQEIEYLKSWVKESFTFLGYMDKETITLEICGNEFIVLVGQSGMSDFYQLNCFRKGNDHYIHLRITGDDKAICLERLEEIQSEGL